MIGNHIHRSHNAITRVMRTLTVLSGLVLLTSLTVRSLLRKTNRRNLAEHIEKDMQAGRDAVVPMVKNLEGQVSDLRETVEKSA